METIADKWKNRKLRKKQQEIEELKMEIEKAKLIKQLEEIQNGKQQEEF